MPNVKGLNTAPDLLAILPDGHSGTHGPHTSVARAGQVITLTKGSTILAVVDFGTGTVKPKVSAKLARIDGDTVTAVNAFLKPYGKVKAYWRTGEYRWHPVNGPASAPVQTPVLPTTAAPAAPAANPALAPAAVVAPRPKVQITVQPAGGKGVVIIPTEKRHDGRQPTVKAITKTYSTVGDVLLPTVDANTLERAWQMRQAGDPHHVLITGPAGTAKTRLAEQFAFTKGVPFLIVEGQSIQTAADWYGGYVPAAGGGFEWVWSDFGLALRRGDPMVILIDEINRPENERALNGLMGLLAWTRQTHPVGAPEALTLAPGILIVATLNEGVEYVGTVEIDAAVRDRFSAGVAMDFTPEVIESRLIRQMAPGLDAEVSKRLVRVASSQRAKRDDDTLFPSHNVLSPRVVIDIARTIVATGCEPSEAIWAACRVRFSREDSAALSVLIEAQFGAAPLPLDTLPDDDDVEQMLGAD